MEERRSNMRKREGENVKYERQKHRTIEIERGEENER